MDFSGFLSIWGGFGEHFGSIFGKILHAKFGRILGRILEAPSAGNAEAAEDSFDCL